MSTQFREATPVEAMDPAEKARRREALEKEQAALKEKISGKNPTGPGPALQSFSQKVKAARRNNPSAGPWIAFGFLWLLSYVGTASCVGGVIGVSSSLSVMGTVIVATGVQGFFTWSQYHYWRGTVKWNFNNPATWLGPFIILLDVVTNTDGAFNLVPHLWNLAVVGDFYQSLEWGTPPHLRGVPLLFFSFFLAILLSISPEYAISHLEAQKR